MNRAGTALWSILASLLLLGGAAAFIILFLLRPSSPHASTETPPATETLFDPTRYPRLHTTQYDDSGYGMIDSYVLPIKDPRSLEQIRDSYQGAGYRGVEALRRQLQNDDLFPAQRVSLLATMARLFLYEGDFKEASRVLAEARTRIEADPERLRGEFPAILFLQGMTALRRGETENCVECGCESSCILPIQPTAVHQKPDGSREAVRFFADYLRIYPDEVGVQWLLNVAAMTLGEYPDSVPPPYRLPLAPLQSDVEVGRFVDIAPRLGLNRLNLSGGAIMDDFDNDGRLDLVVTSFDEGQPMAFYRNKGDGTFEDRTAAAGLEKQLGGLYCVQTDYNNDGWLDIYVARGGWKQLMRHSLLRNNRDGTFTDVTKEAGLDTPVAGQVAAWADYDNDGLLDLFVGSEVAMVNGKEVPSRCRLYHNRGDGTFEEVALKAGVANEGFFCKGATWGDFDGDGYPDLFVANFNGPCRLFHNNRDGTFTDVARRLGVTRPTKAFACWFFDYDNDGWPDLFVASFDRTLNDVVNSQLGRPFNVQSCRLYHNLQGKSFEDVTEAMGLEKAMPVMGCNFFDLDNDGFLDMYLGTGDPNYSMLVPNRLFKNVEGKRFADVTLSSGTGHLQKGHGVACGDWDRDGNVDLFVELGGAAPGDRYRNVLFQNPGHATHWLTVKLAGQKTNRPAVGARIAVTVPGHTFYRTVSNGSSFGGNPFEQTIGLGKATRIERLEVFWPTSRTTQLFRDVAVDQAIALTEFAGDYKQLHRPRIRFDK
jgi:hypothetical protein